MSLKILSTGEMVTLSEPWTNKSSAPCAAIRAIPDLVPIAARVSEAHTELFTTQPNVNQATVSALTDQALQLDSRHDTLARSIYGLVTGFAEAAANADETRALLELRDVLFPEGLQGVNRSFREEAGATKLLSQRLTREHRAALQKLPLPGSRTVLDQVDEFLSVGKRLGEIEDRRAAEQMPGGTTGTDVIRARNKWIRAVNALLSMAELVEMPADTYQLVFGPLRAAEKAAERRQQRRGNPTDPNAPVPPVTPGGGTPTP